MTSDDMIDYAEKVDTITLQDLRDALDKLKNYFNSTEENSLIKEYKEYYDKYVLGIRTPDEVSADKILEDILKET